MKRQRIGVGVEVERVVVMAGARVENVYKERV